MNCLRPLQGAKGGFLTQISLTPQSVFFPLDPVWDPKLMVGLIYDYRQKLCPPLPQEICWLQQ